MNALVMWVQRRMLRINWMQRKTNIWVRDKVDVKEEEGLPYSIKRKKWLNLSTGTRRPESLVLSSIEAELPGKN